MHTRLTTLEAPPESIYEATRVVQELVLSQLQQMDGYKGSSPSVIKEVATAWYGPLGE